jgi:hypothetical protein
VIVRDFRVITIWLVLLLIAAPVLFTVKIQAAGLNNRSVLIGSSTPGITTTYTFSFDITSVTNLGSIQLQFCSNSPLASEPCVPPAGFDISTATLDTQTGETGFIIDPGVTANDLLLSRIPVLATPQPVLYEFSGVINPSTPNATNYVRVFTFASTDGTGPSTEDGGLAFAILEDFSVSAYVPPFLQFCVGVTITGNDCSTASGNLIDFGILSTGSASVGYSQINGATNAFGGLGISMIGTSMTSGINVIPGLASPTVSLPGSSQFGLNLRANGGGLGGANPSGPGTTLPTLDYNSPNQFTFNNGAVIAASPLSTDFSTLTATYLVNISPVQKPGVYTATITYVATASF